MSINSCFEVSKKFVTFFQPSLHTFSYISNKVKKMKN
jgi:hypothetical protein